MKLQKPSDLARLVKNARAERDLTQQDVATAVGITRQSLARLERGNGGASFDTVILILDHLGIQLDATEVEPKASAPIGTAGTSDALAFAREVASRLPQVEGLLPSHLAWAQGIADSPVLQYAEIPPSTFALARDAIKWVLPQLDVPGAVTQVPSEAPGLPSGSEAEVDHEADSTEAGK